MNAMPITKGLLCDCYLNLNKPGYLSIRAAEGPDKGRVVGYVSAIELAGCTFRVSEAGRQRVIRERCKNVHASVRGRIVQSSSEEAPSSSLVARLGNLMANGGIDTTFNPYFTPTFIDRESKRPVYAAQTVVIIGKKVAASSVV
jgi:hypothetical protein